MNNFIDLRIQTRLSLVWVVVGFINVILAPWYAIYFPAKVLPVLNVALPGITAALLLWNLITALRLVVLTGSVASAFAIHVLQLFLFLILFMQIAVHRGANHYEMTEDQHPRDWLVFVGLHAFRAADVADTIEAYELDLQNVRHNSNLTALAVIGLHLYVDLFVLAWLAGLFQRTRPVNMVKRSV